MRGRGRRSSVPHTPVHTPPRRRRHTKQPWVWGKAKPWAKYTAPTKRRMSLHSKKSRKRRGNIVPQYQPPSPAIIAQAATAPPAIVDRNIFMNSKNEMFIRLTNMQAVALVPDTFVDLYNESLPLPPYLTTFTDLKPEQVVQIAEIFAFDHDYPRFNEVNEDLSEDNPLYFGFISAELRDPNWHWNKTISFAAEIDADKLRATWYISYEALSKPALVTMSAGTKADLYKKANAYMLKMHKRRKSGRTSMAAAPTFDEAQTQRETMIMRKFSCSINYWYPRRLNQIRNATSSYVL